MAKKPSVYKTIKFAPPALQHIPALDGVRGIAVLMVIAFHFFQKGWPDLGAVLQVLAVPASFGQTGVDLFFVLSGFLITRILLKSKRGPGYYKNFFARRALRLLPLSLGFLALTYGIMPMFGYGNWVPLSEQIWYWLYLSNIAIAFNIPTSGPVQFWSLSVEEHFYFLWPFCVALFAGFKLVGVSFALIIVALVSRMILIGAGFNDFSEYFFTLSRIDSLAIGTVLAIVESEQGLERYKKQLVYILFVSTILAIAIVVYETVIGTYWLRVVKYPIIAIMFAALIGMVATNSNTMLSRMFRMRWLRFTGKISYGMYVFHLLVIDWVARMNLTGGTWVSMAAVILGTYAVSWASFRWFETPFLNLKRHFGEEQKAPNVGPSLAAV